MFADETTVTIYRIGASAEEATACTTEIDNAQAALMVSH